ncbi:1318_t:CDS:2 [Acaulospora morrowiae]|uniref:1318_t:CDS:1 n=1 Tax=Acaulospora morrowiae TaxID=94023 RepID=A0A9N8WBU0_9GLOM|nr:1318_t:CDS:2 [Acaulospora morrowiae]
MGIYEMKRSKIRVSISEQKAQEFYEHIQFIIPDIIPSIFGFNADTYRAIHCSILAPLVEISFDDIRPSEELTQSVENALQSMNPYFSLSKVFEKFGHLIPCKIIIGKKLTRNCQEFSSVPYRNANHFIKTAHKNDGEFRSILNKWKNIVSLYGFDSTYLIGNEGCVKIEQIEKWMAKDDLQLEIVEYSDLKPTYEILDPLMYKNTKKCFAEENQVLMTGYIKIDDINISDYEVEFDAPLQSNNYKVFGFITNSNLENLKNLIVQFKSFTKYGFKATLKRLDNENILDYNISWIMMGIPKVVGFYSINTRDLDLSGEQEVKIDFFPDEKEYYVKLSCPSNFSICFLSTLIEFPQNEDAPLMEINYFDRSRVDYSGYRNGFE